MHPYLLITLKNKNMENIKIITFLSLFANQNKYEMHPYLLITFKNKKHEKYKDHYLSLFIHLQKLQLYQL
jgi:hypothetical protein